MVHYFDLVICVAFLTSLAEKCNGIGGNLPDFRFKCLERHNQYRRRHGAEPLTLSNSLNHAAEIRAKELADMELLNVLPRRDLINGETIFISDRPMSGRAVVDAWYRQEKNYNYNWFTPPYPYTVDAFTQIVWTSTRRLGVGRAVSRSGIKYVVCLYSPPGNIMGQYRTHVNRPTWLKN